MGTSGGFAQRIRIPAGWAVKCPEGLSLHASMVIGTAGFTAAECVQKLEQSGMTPDSGPVLVTGSTGGVGSVAVKLLSQLGYDVTAVTGKAEKSDWLKGLGAASVISREAATAGADKPLLAETWVVLLILWEAIFCLTASRACAMDAAWLPAASLQRQLSELQFCRSSCVM